MPHRRSISLGFTDEVFREGMHICYIFNDDFERHRVMAKYLESGLLAREKVLCLVDYMTPKEMLDSLHELGIAVHSDGGELTVTDASPAYCPSGSFHVDETLAMLRRFHVQAIEEGYAGSRVTGGTNWCMMESRANLEGLMGYEARVNLLLAEYPSTACCQYDARRFDGETIMDVLSVHPFMIVRGQLVRNPYFVDPALFLQELRARKGQDGGIA